MAIFIDLKKAFDSVRHVDIFQHLMGEEVPRDIIQLLLQIYNKDNSIFIINQEQQEAITNQKGVKQGASTSPILFNLLVKQIIILFEQRRLGLTIDNHYTGILAFADDIVMIA